MQLSLSLLPDTLAVCRMDANQVYEPWMLQGDFCSVTRTKDELSLVMREQDIPSGIQAEGGWRCLKVIGPLDFSLIGILANLSTSLTNAGVSLFAISTFDTDYILLKQDALSTGIRALRAAGHTLLE